SFPCAMSSRWRRLALRSARSRKRVTARCLWSNRARSICDSPRVRAGRRNFQSAHSEMPAQTARSTVRLGRPNWTSQSNAKSAASIQTNLGEGNEAWALRQIHQLAEEPFAEHEGDDDGERDPVVPEGDDADRDFGLGPRLKILQELAHVREIVAPSPRL